MGSFRSTSRCVLCLAGTAALLILIDTICQIMLYSRVPDGTPRLATIVIGGIIALIVPCCGWQGVRDRSDGLLCYFSCCSFFLGCVDVLVVALCGMLLFIAVTGSRVAHACSSLTSATCDPETRDQLHSLCEQFSIQYNETMSNVSSLSDERKSEVIHEVSDLMSEQKCIDTLKDLTFAMAVIGAVVAVARCLNVCLHCASWHYGGKLRVMLDEDPHRDMSSESESD
mmetsp:Transcript_79964/g.232164  ORF Transcript_79964/g.232164 Transcript_79964/m.232164 type:complete len:227 (-) Transcript_79964:500-1180(-)|eukprot:CAMPEP_0176081898 /NCGR_PEP_ID=MMETSP0120_2-20121206/40966_1 /TAXON_ID=160619 /ORGANISM="Kryptoperidinium foliaceum, Strain CCMP 1326" /LENGTH=226 /DNA_ID=CAMNT_0017415665 /DNA_START=110 /DNA_END=790 /DNA_ORIENTATION=-